MSALYCLNEDFKTEKSRITIPFPSAVNIGKEAKSTSDLWEDKGVLHGAIVRVMKMHKTLSQDRLIAEVRKLCASHFSAEKQEIVSRVEDLIARAYMQRRDGNSPIYEYVS